MEPKTYNPDHEFINDVFASFFNNPFSVSLKGSKIENIKTYGDSCDLSETTCSTISCNGNAYIKNSSVTKVKATGNILLLNCPNVKEVESTDGIICTLGCRNLTTIKARDNIICQTWEGIKATPISTEGRVVLLLPETAHTLIYKGAKAKCFKMDTPSIKTIIVDSNTEGEAIIFSHGEPSSNKVIVKLSPDNPNFRLTIPVINATIIYEEQD